MSTFYNTNKDFSEEFVTYSELGLASPDSGGNSFYMWSSRSGNALAQSTTTTPNYSEYVFINVPNAQTGLVSDYPTDPDVWVSGAIGSSTTYGIAADKTLWAWGINDVGQLGVNNVIGIGSPRQVGSNTWNTISVGHKYVVGIQSNGTLWSWGFNTVGQLGLGDSASRSRPTQIGSANNWTRVSCGTTHFAALNSNNKLFMSGNGANGQLGIGSTASTLTFTAVLAFEDWNSVIASHEATYGIKTDNTLWSWGLNTFGQLGHNNIILRSSPVQVGSASNWSAVASSNSTVYALNSSNQLWGWGRNSTNELDTFTTVPRSSPVQIGSSISFKALPVVGSNASSAPLTAIADSNYLYQARWPLVIGQNSYVISNDLSAGDNFGRSIGIDPTGTYLVVGAPKDDDGASNTGSVYIFGRSSLNTWTQLQKLSPSVRSANDNFGFSVGISNGGNRIVAGSYSGIYGNVYVFDKTVGANNWTQSLRIANSADNTKSSIGPGVSISRNGNVIAFPTMSNTTSPLTLDIYTRGLTSWSHSNTATANTSYNPAIGLTIPNTKMSEDGSVIVLADSSNTALTSITNGGAAFVFRSANLQSWTLEHKLINAACSVNDYFAYSVDITSDGSRIACGIPLRDNGALLDQGTVNIFAYNTTTSRWDYVENVIDSAGIRDDLFGWSVSFSPEGDYILVGAPGDDLRGNTAGAIHLFRRSTLSANSYSSLQVTANLTTYQDTSDQYGLATAITNNARYIVGGSSTKGLPTAGGMVGTHLVDSIDLAVLWNNPNSSNVYIGDYFYGVISNEG
jgi:hypothetical protein